jgi:uncharacterized protein (DUF3084 family)
VTENKNAEQDK